MCSAIERPATGAVLKPQVSIPGLRKKRSTSLPKLPVPLTFHENRSGRGYIVQVHNTYPPEAD
jgi:hypothetical protein